MIKDDVFETIAYIGLSQKNSKNRIKKIKASLVARGFHEDSSNLIKDSPTSMWLISGNCLNYDIVVNRSSPFSQ